MRIFAISCLISRPIEILRNVCVRPAGYALLLPDPVVADLNVLTMIQRINFLQDMTILGDALLAVTGASRINYEILGNSETALHAHVFPRYATEPEEKRRKPVWFYDWKSAVAFDAERDGQLMQEIAEAISRCQSCISSGA